MKIETLVIILLNRIYRFSFLRERIIGKYLNKKISSNPNIIEYYVKYDQNVK